MFGAMEWRHSAGLLASAAVWHYWGRGVVLYLMVLSALPFIRRLLLKSLSLLMYRTGLSVGYVSLWNCSVMGVGFRRRNEWSRLGVAIGEIRISSFRPLELVVSDISVSLSSRRRAMQSPESALSDAVEAVGREGRVSASRVMQLLFSVFTRVLSLLRVRVTNISVQYSRFPPLADMIVELQEFTFHPIADSNQSVIPFAFSLEEFTIITRETIFSQGRSDLHIPKLLLSLSVARAGGSLTPQEVRVSLEDGYSVHVTSASVRYFLCLLHGTSSSRRGASKSSSPPLLERRLPLSLLYGLYRALIPCRVELDVARAEHYLHANRLVLPVHLGFSVHYNAMHGEQSPRELHLSVLMSDLLVGSVAQLDSLLLSLDLDFLESFRTGEFTVDEYLEQSLRESRVCLRACSPSLHASPEWVSLLLLLLLPRKLDHLEYIGLTMSSLLHKHRSAPLESLGSAHNSSMASSSSSALPAPSSSSSASMRPALPQYRPPLLTPQPSMPSPAKLVSSPMPGQMAAPDSLPPPLPEGALGRFSSVKLRRYTNRWGNPMATSMSYASPTLGPSGPASQSALQSLLARLGRLKLSVSLDLLSSSVGLSASLQAPAFSTMSVAHVSVQLCFPPSPSSSSSASTYSSPLKSSSSCPSAVVSVDDIEWLGTVLSRSCSYSPHSDAPGRLVVLPSMVLRGTLHSLPMLILESSLTVPSLRVNLSVPSLSELTHLRLFLETLAAQRAARSAAAFSGPASSAAPAPAPASSSRGGSGALSPPLSSSGGAVSRVFHSLTLQLRDVRVSFHSLSSDSEGLLLQFPSSELQFSESRATAQFVLDRLHVSSFRSPERDLLSVQSVSLRVCPSRNVKVRTISIGVNRPNCNLSFGFLYELLSLVQRVRSELRPAASAEACRVSSVAATPDPQASAVFSPGGAEGMPAYSLASGPAISRSSSVLAMPGASRLSANLEGGARAPLMMQFRSRKRSLSSDAGESRPATLPTTLEGLKRALPTIPGSPLQRPSAPPPDLSPPPKFRLMVTVTCLSVSLDLSPWVWRWSVKCVLLQRHNRGVVTAGLSSLVWSTTDQSEPFLTLSTLSLRLVPPRTALVSLGRLGVVYDERSGFGEALGAAIAERKTMKTLLRGFVYAETHPGRDQKLLSGRAASAPAAESVLVDVSLSRFSFRVLGDSRRFSRPLVTGDLGNIRVSQLRLECEWNPVTHGRAGLLRRVQTLDDAPTSPLAWGYDDVLGCDVRELSCGLLSAYLGDYPLPLLEATNVSVSGFACMALVEDVERSLRLVSYTLHSFGFFPPRRQEVTRGGDNVKFYCDLSASLATCHVSYGIFMGELLSAFTDALGDITPPNSDRVSPKLMFWDKLRYMIHGRFRLDCRHHLTLDLFYSYPYDCGKLRLIFKDLLLETTEASRFVVRSHGCSGYVLTESSKCDRFLRTECLTCSLSLAWTTRGQPCDHHVFQQDVYEPSDVYYYFRSQQLSISADIDFFLPEYSYSSSPLVICLRLKENLVWLLAFVKMFLSSFSPRSMTLGVLLTRMEVRASASKPRLLVNFDSDSTLVYSLNAERLTLSCTMGKLLFGTERFPTPASKSVMVPYSLAMTAKSMQMKFWERGSQPIHECPEPEALGESSLLTTAQEVLLSTGLDESRYAAVVNKQPFDLNLDLMDPSNPNYIELSGLQVVFTFITKRYLFGFKDSLLGILFPPAYVRRDSIPAVFQRNHSNWRIIGTAPRHVKREDENPLLQRILQVTKGTPSYKFLNAVKPSPAQSASFRFRLSMILKAKGFQILFMTPDSPLNTILVGKKLFFASTVKLGRLSQDMSKMEAFIRGGSSYILLQGSSSKVEWVTPALLERITRAADTDNYHISPKWLRETDLSFTFSFNPLPPTSVNMLDPVIQSDELSKISVYLTRMDVQATSRDMFQAIETFRNIIFFSFSSSKADPPPHKPGAAKLPAERLQEMRQRLEQKLQLSVEEDHSVTSMIQFHSSAGTFLMLDDTGVNFATVAFREFKFNRYSHQDGSVLNTFSMHCFHFRVNPPAFREGLDSDILSPSNEEVPQEDNMFTALAEMSPQEVIDGWPITVYNNIEISVFPCSTTVLRITLIAKLLNYITRYVFPKTGAAAAVTAPAASPSGAGPSSSSGFLLGDDDNDYNSSSTTSSRSTTTSRRTAASPSVSQAAAAAAATAAAAAAEVAACAHEYERYNASTSEAACAICRRVVKDMTTVQYQCRLCGSKVHAYCKDTAESGVNEETLVYLNSLRIGDLKLMVSIKGFRVNLQEWETSLKMISLSKRFTFWSSVSGAVMGEYQSELLRLIPAIIMKKLSRRKTRPLLLDSMSQRLQRLQLSRGQSERERADLEKRKEIEKWSTILDDDPSSL